MFVTYRVLNQASYKQNAHYLSPEEMTPHQLTIVERDCGAIHADHYYQLGEDGED